MAEYGESIDGSDMQRMDVYNYFVNYFGNPLMKKIKNLNGGYTMYCCKIKSMLTKDKKYIFVIINPQQTPDLEELYLQDIYWDIIQTRMIEDHHNVPVHSYQIKPSVPHPIKVFEKNDDAYKYTCQKFPNIIVNLMFTKNQTRVYGDRGDLGLAVETYNTIISFE